MPFRAVAAGLHKGDVFQENLVGRLREGGATESLR